MRDKMKNVSLRTKLIVACTAMVLIPLVLTLLSFCLLRLYMTHRMGSQAALIFAEQKIDHDRTCSHCHIKVALLLCKHTAAECCKAVAQRQTQYLDPSFIHTKACYDRLIIADRAQHKTGFGT